MEPLAQTIAAGLGAILAFAAFIYVLCIVLTWAERVIMAWRRPDADATYAWKLVDQLRADLAYEKKRSEVLSDKGALAAERLAAETCAIERDAARAELEQYDVRKLVVRYEVGDPDGDTGHDVHAESLAQVQDLIDQGSMDADDLANARKLASEDATKLQAQRDHLAKFKSYVHHRLDEAGVPVDPDSPHKADGCRIGGRLDWLLARVAVAQAAADVLAERQRQVTAEGWTPEHDDAHGDGSLATAAACYALLLNQEFHDSRFNDHFRVPVLWPDTWAASWWKPKGPRRDLVRAGALILAEIERLDRAEVKPAAEPDKAEVARIKFLRAGGCSCHLSPPCTWCTTLTEDEVDARAHDGASALDRLLIRKLQAAEKAGGANV